MARTRQQKQASPSDVSIPPGNAKVKHVTKSKMKSTIPKGAGDNVEGLTRSTETKAKDDRESVLSQQDTAEPDTFEVPYRSSSIACNVRSTAAPAKSSMMVITHGAGGTLSTPSIAHFAQGFCLFDGSVDSNHPTISSIISFQGNMNFKSRTTMFQAVIEYCNSDKPSFNTNGEVKVLGGSSMGARASVVTASLETGIEKLVLLSYPLQAGEETRDQVLLDIDEKIEVLFVIGSKDHMCDIDQLNGVRAKMKAKSWLLTVEDANHGINHKKKKLSNELQTVTGRLAAEWVAGADVKSTTADVGGIDGCEVKMHLPLKQHLDSRIDTKSSANTSKSTKRKSSKTTTENEDQPPATKTKKRKSK